MRDRIFRFLAYIFEKNDNRSVVACLIYDKYADRQVVHTEVFKNWFSHLRLPEKNTKTMDEL